MASTKLTDSSIIIVPGLNNSDEQHWQSRWQAEWLNSQRIDAGDWKTADLDRWRAGIIRALQNSERPAILVAHSFGALAAISVAEQYPELVRALFLVAPADPAKFGITARLPERPVGVPALLVASSNDPWLSESKAAYLALLWGADYLRLKEVGHINSQSGLGHWPEGRALLRNLLRKSAARESLRESSIVQEPELTFAFRAFVNGPIVSPELLTIKTPITA